MHEEGLTARKIAEFDSAIFDEYRTWESAFDWNPLSQPDRYVRGDGTHLIYLPINEQRSIIEGRGGFGNLTKNYPPAIQALWDDILKKQCEYLAGLTGINDPVVVQADIARMKPLTGDTVMHNDTRYNQRYSRRYNIAMSTNTDCWLYHHSYDLNNGGMRDHINEGEVWELNNKIVHTAVNSGATWRTHLIIDVMPRNYYDRMCELYNPYAKVPNPQGKNTTYDIDNNGNLIHEPLFTDLPHCFPARTHIL
jgi:hypothetical protein